MTAVKNLEYVRPGSKPKDQLAKLEKGKRAASEIAPSNDDRNQTDKWFLGFDAKKSIEVPRGATPQFLVDVLKKPTGLPATSSNKEYERSKFLLTGLHSGDESRVEIALLSAGEGGGFADVMPAEDGFIVTVPELFEFEEKSFTADEFLQAVDAAKAQFQLRGTAVASLDSTSKCTAGTFC